MAQISRLLDLFEHDSRNVFLELSRIYNSIIGNTRSDADPRWIRWFLNAHFRF